jgi:hypothetical protein
MEHLKLLRNRIRESEELANCLWFEQLELSNVSIWDRIKLGAVTAAIVTSGDKDINGDAIVELVVAEVTESDSFIVDAIFGIELDNIVTRVRNASDSDRVSVEMNTLASALLEPILTSLGVGIEGLDDKSRKLVEDCVRNIGGSAAIATLFYNAAKKIS